jgi:hypothetical protein
MTTTTELEFRKAKAKAVALIKEHFEAVLAAIELIKGEPEEEELRPLMDKIKRRMVEDADADANAVVQRERTRH